MKGQIILQPIRKDIEIGRERPLFVPKEGTCMYVDCIIDGFVFDEEGYSVPLDMVSEFMVKIGDKFYELNVENIVEAIDNDWWDYYGTPDDLEFSIENNVATVVMDPIELGKTERGFGSGKFIDQYGSECSIQVSSIATKSCIWLGIDDANPLIMASDANRLGINNTNNQNGWIKYDIPSEVLLHTRMHLSREDVKRLLPLLIKFSETGEL